MMRRSGGGQEEVMRRRTGRGLEEVMRRWSGGGGALGNVVPAVSPHLIFLEPSLKETRLPQAVDEEGQD